MIPELAGRLPELWLRTGEHVLLTGISTAAAILIGVPLGILAHRMPSVRGPLLGTIGVLQTIPSLAMLAILLALLSRIGVVPAIVALIMYALLPIVRNTLAGLDGIAPEVTEASRGLGMTAGQETGNIFPPWTICSRNLIIYFFYIPSSVFLVVPVFKIIFRVGFRTFRSWRNKFLLGYPQDWTP